MNYEIITGIPIENLTSISDRINDLDSNNVRESNRKERQELEKKLALRQRNIYQQPLSIDNSKIIPRLRRLLSKKFELTLNDYIIIIDKFKLNSNDLTRNTIEELLLYLKSQDKFTKKHSEFINKNDEIQASKVAALDKEEFDKNFKEMELERNIYIKSLQSDKNSQTQEENIRLDISSKPNILPEIDINKEIKIDNNDNLSINSADAPILKNENIQNDIKNNIFSKNQNNVEEHIVSYQNSENLSNNILSKNHKDLLLETPMVEEVLMLNILKDEINGEFFCKIKYNNQDKIDDISKIEFLGCHMNKYFCEKNNINKCPSIIIRIEEFDNNFFINGSNISGFCQCLLDKNNSYYIYNHKDKYFGVYEPKKNFTLNNLTIKIYDISGKMLKDISHTENDLLNLMFKIYRKV